MPILTVTTTIAAPIERVFDLCRSVDAHLASAAATGERAVGGTTTGLLGLHDQVTWRARHFGWRWQLTSRITQLTRPHHFRDSMVQGPFARFDHDHHFEHHGGATHVRDVFDFASPLGVLGRIADRLFVTAHMRRFLTTRMQTVKQLAEGPDWRRFLPDPPPR